MIHKVCNVCQLNLSIDRFDWDKNRPSPRKTCKKCRAKNRTYSLEQKNRIRQYKKQYNASGKAKDVWEKCKYGVSKSQLTYSHCLICGSTHRLCIDHNHSTGEFRGLLCSKCNAGLGMFSDDIGKLRNAISYLKHFENGGEGFKTQTSF